MTDLKLTKLELKVLEKLWSAGPSSVREIQECFDEAERPAYTTVQTIIYRLEAKGAAKRVKKVGNAHIFEAVVSKSAARSSLVDDLLAPFGGRPQLLMAHLIESGQLTLDDIEDARKTLKELKKAKKGKR